MAFDVMDLIKNGLGSEQTGAIAGALGMDNSIVKKGLAARGAGDTVDGAVARAQQTAQKSSSLIRWVVFAAVILAAFYFLSGELA
jgi:hypothetical protein